MQQIIKMSDTCTMIKAFSFEILIKNSILMIIFLLTFFYLKFYTVFFHLNLWPLMLWEVLIFLFIYYLVCFDFFININKNIKIDGDNVYIDNFKCSNSDILGVHVIGGTGAGRGSNITYRVFIELKTQSFFRKKKWVISAPSEKKALDFALVIADFLDVATYNKKNEVYTNNDK